MDSSGRIDDHKFEPPFPAAFIQNALDKDKPTYWLLRQTLNFMEKNDIVGVHALMLRFRVFADLMLKVGMREACLFALAHNKFKPLGTKVAMEGYRQWTAILKNPDLNDLVPSQSRYEIATANFIRTLLFPVPIGRPTAASTEDIASSFVTACTKHVTLTEPIIDAGLGPVYTQKPVGVIQGPGLFKEIEAEFHEQNEAVPIYPNVRQVINTTSGGLTVRQTSELVEALAGIANQNVLSKAAPSLGDKSIQGSNQPESTSSTPSKGSNDAQLLLNNQQDNDGSDKVPEGSDNAQRPKDASSTVAESSKASPANLDDQQDNDGSSSPTPQVDEIVNEKPAVNSVSEKSLTVGGKSRSTKESSVSDRPEPRQAKNVKRKRSPQSKLRASPRLKTTSRAHLSRGDKKKAKTK